MGRTEWCEFVSGVCRLTGGVEESEGSGHVSTWLSAEKGAGRTGLTRASLSVESAGEQPVG